MRYPVHPAAQHGSHFSAQWGYAWPPPNDTENFAGEEIKDEFGDPKGANEGRITVIASYHDSWRRTAPVGSFSSNSLGLFDLAGNAREWCVEPCPAKESDYLLRGGVWDAAERANLLSSARFHPTSSDR